MIKKLSPGHIKDLTEPKFVEIDCRNEKGIADLHSMMGDSRPVMVVPDDVDVCEKIDVMNAIYHNHVIEVLFGEGVVEYGNQLRCINRSSW